MREAVSVFVTGIVGVFAGMALLYLTVRLNAFVAGKIDAWRASRGEPAAEPKAPVEDQLP
ncbi:MAG: hypothetical protein LJF06_15900 [Gemmatimonadetes bacterium]|jgi:hypothetical protein|nr:hypothetical protein [Gemmatimonadota bacterium]